MLFTHLVGLLYGGGGNGLSWGGTAQSGMPNTGGGGGGAGSNDNTGVGGAGGSGIVIIRYPLVNNEADI